MTQMPGSLQDEVIVIGNEGLAVNAVATIKRLVRPDETVIACSGFDFESKVLAVTDQRIIIADKNGNVNFLLGLDELVSVTRETRTLVIGTKFTSAKYRMGDENTVAEIERLITDLVGANYDQEPTPDMATANSNDEKDLSSPNIAERVKFWEEQDKINQELIPRVIRQNELLTSHIADHENLPLIAGNAIREALAQAREEQRQQHEAEMAELRAEAEEQRQQQELAMARVRAQAEDQRRQHLAELEEARAAREEQSRQHNSQITALQQQAEQQRQQHEAQMQAARDEREQQAQALAESKAAAAEQARQHQAELEAAKAEREEQARQHSNEVAVLQGQVRKSRNLHTAISAGAVAIAVAAVIVGFLI